MSARHSVAILGFSGTGKTHFGGQLIGRLRQPSSRLQLAGVSGDRKLFEGVLRQLQEGLSAEHTPTEQYGEEVLTIRDRTGELHDVSWPDYGGEQLADLLQTRRVSEPWRERLSGARGWALFVRPGALTVLESAATRPHATPEGRGAEADKQDDNARYVELLQILLYVCSVSIQSRIDSPRLAVVVSCWDELARDRTPADELVARLPFFSGFLRASWRPEALSIWGLSSLERSLGKENPDLEYVEQGPERFGYVVDETGQRSSDLTELVEWLIRR